MTKKDRIRAAVNGEQPDRMPYSFWTHMPGIDTDPEKIAEKTYELYKKYDWDFIKTMNSGMYSIEDFGCKIDASEVLKGGVSKITETQVHCSEDLYKLKEVPIEEGAYARELKHLQLVLDKVKEEDVPVITTVFSPLTTLDKICGKVTVKANVGNDNVKDIKVSWLSIYMKENPDAMKAALEEITKTTEKYAARVIENGADGIFFASQMSSYNQCTLQEYLEFGKEYDLRVIKAADKGWMNTIHCHGDNLIFEVLKDYPVQIFNWHAWETLPDVNEAYVMTGKCLMGGINRKDITERKKEKIQNQIFQCYKEMGGKHQILTPGCVIRYPLDTDMLMYIKNTLREIEEKLKR